MFREDYQSDRDEKTEWLRPFYRTLELFFDKVGFLLVVLLSIVAVVGYTQTDYSGSIVAIAWYTAVHAVTLIWTRETVPPTIYMKPLPYHTTLLTSLVGGLLLLVVYGLFGIGTLYTGLFVVVGWLSTRKFYYMVRTDKWNFAIDPPATLLYLIIVLPYRVWFFALCISLVSQLTISSQITFYISVVSIVLPLLYAVFRSLTDIPRQETQSDDPEFKEAMKEFYELYTLVQSVETTYNALSEEPVEIAHKKADLTDRELQITKRKLQNLDTDTFKQNHPIHTKIETAMSKIEYIQSNYRINSNATITKKSD